VRWLSDLINAERTGSEWTAAHPVVPPVRPPKRRGAKAKK